MIGFDKPFTGTKIISKVKKKFLWVFPYKCTTDYWIVDKSFRYYLNDEEFIEVPVGFATVLATVPRALWTIFPKDGPWTQPAVLHDYIYNRRGVMPTLLRILPRNEGDSIFLNAMKLVGVDLADRRLIYRGVRLGGWLYWNKK